MVVLRDYYFKLASELPNERIESAVALIKDLNDANDTQEYDYALNRLIKGLNTSRQSARYGFSMALTELIQELIVNPDYDLTITTYLNKILDIIEITKNMKGKDERSALFGRLFGFQTLINLKLLFNKQYTTRSDIMKLIDCFFELSIVKTWLRETTIFTLIQFITSLEMNNLQNINEIFDYVLTKTNECNLNSTCEGIAIFLTIPNTSGKIANNWKNNNPLSRGNLPTLAKVLKEADIEDNEVKQKGSWTPRLHFVWDIIIDKLLALQFEADQPKSKKRKTNKSSQLKSNDLELLQLKEFWKAIIDDNFFSEKSSHERKYWGFEIFTKTFVKIEEPKLISQIITPNFTRCLINQSAQSNRMLNKISIKVLNTIKEECQKHPNKSSYTLNCLIDSKFGGCWNFDLITKSRTIESLVNLKQDNLLVIELIKEVIINQFNQSLINDNEKSQDPERELLKKPHDNIQKWCLTSLLQLIRSNKIFIGKGEWIKDILNLIILNSFFRLKNLVSINVRNLCKERLNSILSEIINYKNDQKSWSLYCIEFIKAQNIELIEDFDSELDKIRLDCENILNDIGAMNSSSKVYNFELLFSMVLLQIYNGDEDSFQVVDELKICYEKAFEDNDVDDGEDNSSVILTEIILSFISKKSSLLRKFSLIIWENLLCQPDEHGNSRLNEDCFELLFNVLTTRENKEGQQALFDDDEGMQVEEDDDEDDDGKEDADEGDEKADDDDEDSDNEDSNDDDDDEGDEEIDKQTNIKLAQALGIPTGNSGEVKFEDLSSEDEDDSSYESDSMDDEQMMAMDDQLSKIFKERRNILSNVETGNKRKTDVIEARETMIFFKNRIIDLIEIFIKNNEHSEMNFIIIEPLIKLINLTMDKNLGIKAHKLIKSRLSKVKLDDKRVSKTDKSALLEKLMALLSWLHESMNNTKSNNSYILACNQCSILVSKNILILEPKFMNEIIDIYSNSIKLWYLNPKSNIQPSLFFDFINWLNSTRKLEKQESKD